MNELENIPDDFWRKAFDGADERPPQGVWEAIERQLDDDSKARVLPLWGPASMPVQRALLWGTGVAASAALLLAGWWYTQSTDLPRSAASVATHTQTGTGPATASVDASPQSRVTSQQQHPASLAGLDHLPPVGTPAYRRQPSFPEQADVAMMTSAQSAISAALARHYANASIETAPSDQPAAGLESAQQPPQVFRQSISLSIVAVTTTPEQQVPAQSDPVPAEESATITLAAQPAKNQSALAKATPAEATADVATKPIRREKWASLSVMPGAFNPAVALASAPVAIASNSVQAANGHPNTANPSVDSRSSRSVAYQLSAGVQLTDRWSVETGVGYLSAQSTVESPAQVNLASVSMLTTNDAPASNNLFIDAIRSRTAGPANAYVSADRSGVQPYTTGRYSSSERQSVSNDYQFVQVPVQVGYQLRPRKRLGLALIGGFLTNIFVRNTVASQVVVTANDDIYRSLSWAASLGARFRYRPSQHWSASLAGLYQPTIGTSTVSDSPIRSHPTSAGMSFGVDYHF
ncbi:outer membrane beta-barrel protein [Spirosoma rhododendri]|uniref:Outer membrane beta-barrel protein n=1 Tax=Spirosoma rhododendri TaxID=2728024 RepID=A0A7L5DI13_9BACT|nr:outer membrane beta-barrel protein [Spirosoma rhododendri]QJD77969.1 outer membrane beta-barrel protein [Spirosoma rhododendri]